MATCSEILEVPFFDSRPLLMAPPGLVLPPDALKIRMFSSLSASTDASSGTASDEDEPLSPDSRRPSVPVHYHNTLCEAFKMLQSTDPRTVLKVRKLQRLPEATVQDLMADHFRIFGRLAELHLVRSQSRTARRSGANQYRLSGLGFVVMQSPMDLESALACGSEQRIGGLDVCIERFQQAHSP